MSYETILPTGASTRLTSGWVYLDVRSSEEYEEGHPPGAYNIPVAFMSPAGMEPNETFLSVVQRHFPSDTRFVVGCKAGGRSAMACEIMEQGGYESLANMDGGYHGRPDGMGGIAVPGWAACGLDQSVTPEPGRTWAELSG